MPSINELKRYVHPGPHYEPDCASFDFGSNPVRALAYYLPQFHPIPENDQWWGKGFTEWTNVTKSFPRYRGHYQPHLPGELGFYDLRNPEVLYRQAELARRYGIHGFCIHHYWFGGRALLDQPLRILLEHQDIDIHFCLNWANESWTRAWDASEKQILIQQRHSAEDDVAFAKSLEKAISDKRYMRVNGRPMIMVYRPGRFPDIRATVDRWRDHFERAGYGNPYLVMPQADGNSDPHRFGFDAAAGFPPHNYGFGARRRAKGLLVKIANPWYHGLVLSYDRMVQIALRNTSSTYPLLPGVCTTWDNHARRINGVIFHGSTPAKYESWLRAACENTIRQNSPEERIVFINAWNEWAEGAHLEPDRYYGYAYLAATGRVLSSLAKECDGGLLANI